MAQLRRGRAPHRPHGARTRRAPLPRHRRADRHARRRARALPRPAPGRDARPQGATGHPDHTRVHPPYRGAPGGARADRRHAPRHRPAAGPHAAGAPRPLSHVRRRGPAGCIRRACPGSDNAPTTPAPGAARRSAGPPWPWPPLTSVRSAHHPTETTRGLCQRVQLGGETRRGIAPQGCRRTAVYPVRHTPDARRSARRVGCGDLGLRRPGPCADGMPAGYLFLDGGTRRASADTATSGAADRSHMQYIWMWRIVVGFFLFPMPFLVESIAKRAR